MSAWGKYLAPITVGTGGWDFGWGDTSASDNLVTLPAGTYSTILSAARALDLVIDVESTASVTVSATGYVSIAVLTMTSVDMTTTDSRLLDTFGFDTTETVTLASITANDAHRYGWYPGVISHGVARGDGVASDSSWRPVDEVGRVVSGGGQMRAIAASRRRYVRDVRYAAIRRTEYVEAYRGVAMLEEYAATLALRWYPDRALGTASAPGTQGDPADSRTTGDYWLVTLDGAPAIEWSPQYPDLCSVSLALNGEPD